MKKLDDQRKDCPHLAAYNPSDLKSLPDTETKIKYAGVVNACGLGGAIVEKVAAGQMDNLFDEFGNNIKKTLGDTGATASSNGSEDDVEQTMPARLNKIRSPSTVSP